MSLPILDVAIGISFVYLLLALICTTVNEMLAGLRKTRARFLDCGITRLLNDNKELKDKVYQHPLIRSLSPTETSSCPSYLPARAFATALTDVLGDSTTAANVLSDSALTTLLRQTGADPSAQLRAIEQWFNEGMDRVSGWYKRHVQIYTLVLAGVITLVLNADTIHIANILWTSPTTRAAIVEEAKVRSQKARPEELLPLVEYPNPQDPTESKPVNVPDRAMSETEQALLGQMTGWTEEWQRWRGDAERGIPAQPFGPWLWQVIWNHAIGWTLTVVAISIGAPFWFDTLNRFMNIRNAGRAPDERRDKSRPAPAKPAEPAEQPVES